MKNTIVIASALLTAILTSCVKIETNMEPEAIGFGVYAARNTGSTKAGDTFLQTGGSLPYPASPSDADTYAFGVFGYFHPQHGGEAGSWHDAATSASVTNHPNLMLNEKVWWDISSSKYVYTNTRFWPVNTLDRISFFAYYPYDGSNSIVRPQHDDETDGMGDFVFFVDSDPANQVDFMISDLCPDQSKSLWNNSSHTEGLTDSVNGTVKFTFHHVLSQVRIKSVTVNHENPCVEIRINSICFKGIAIRAVCTPEYYETETPDEWATKFTWHNFYTRLGNATQDAQPCYADPSDPSTLDTDKVLLMIPQTLADKKIIVNYDLIRYENEAYKEAHNSEHILYQYTDNTLERDLRTTGCSVWEGNMIYEYVINIHQDGLAFDVVSVQNWGDTNNGGFVILT